MRQPWFLALLFVLPGGAAHGDESHPEFEDRVLEGSLGPMDLHGTRLAWAAMRDAQVELRVTDLRDGQEFVATRVPVDDRSIQSLSFDGRWIAWTDDRYGNLDAFAIDTDTGQLLRLSEHPQNDRDVDVEEGRFAWTREGVMLADDTGNAEMVSTDGGAATPVFAGGWLAWSQLVQERRVIKGLYLADGSVDTLADNEGVMHTALNAASDGHIIWTGVADDKARVQTLHLRPDGTVGENKVLTDWGVYVEPRTGGGYGAWMEPGMVRVERLSDGRSSVIEEYRPPLLSSALLVVTTHEGGMLQIAPTPWSELQMLSPIEPRDPRPYLVAAGLTLLLGSAGIGWWRARRRRTD